MEATAVNDSLRLLLDFDGERLPSEVVADSATVERVAAAEGGGALRVRFSPEDYWSVVRFRPEQPWDWSDLENFNLAIDAANDGDESIQLYISLTNTRGESSHVTGNRAETSNYAGNVGVGESGTYFFIVDGPTVDLNFGKAGIPTPWPTDDEMLYWRYGTRDIDLGAITEVSLNVRGNLTEKSLIVDNLRLRENPQHDLSSLESYVDEFGQNAQVEYPIKVHSVEELKAAADEEVAALEASGPMPDRSRWGGWKDGPRLEATGYFRVEKVDGKWWMVDPEGHLFFSHGPANVRMANLTTLTGVDFRDPSVRQVDPDEVTPEDSIGFVDVSDAARETRFIASDLRHRMFEWLPGYDDPLADHYSFRRSAIMGPLDGGETYNFYSANLERRYGETESRSYLRRWEAVTLARMNDWGFTSFGNWVDPAFYPNEKVPYFANGWIIGDFKTLSSPFDVWAPMPDPFDPEFVRRAEITIGVIADEIDGSPWCVGIFVDNEKSWGYPEGTVEQRYGIIIDALSNDAADSPAKAAFVELLKTRHESIDALNERWQLALDSWDELSPGLEVSEYSPAMVEDFSLLLEALSDEYFRVVHDTLEKVLPNHLYMGARMANWGMPEETIKAAVTYSDVMSFNIYEEGMQPKEWAFLADIDLPTVIGEFHIGATRETGLLHPGLVMADGQADRAAMYRAYMDSVVALDAMVGAHWFQYIDSPLTGRAFDGESYNVGFVAVTDIPYPEMVAAIKAFNRDLYPRRYGSEAGRASSSARGEATSPGR